VPDDAEAHYGLGIALKQKDALNDASAELRKAIALKPSLHEAHYALGAILLQQSNLEDSETAFRAAILVKKDYVEAHYALGTVLQQKGELVGAIAEFREALRLAPNAAEIHNTLGNVLRQKGDVAGARAEFQEAARLNKIKSNQQAAIFASNAGLTQLKNGNIDAALERFQAAVELDPTNSQSYYNLARAFQQKGDTEGARVAYQKAKDLKPKVRPAQ
jgi:eukaryotic-like serine/threonine-protein kinase